MINKIKNYRKVFVVTVAVFVALLHFVIGPNYGGPFKGFLKGYLLDILIPFFFYFLFTLKLTQTQQKISVAVGIVAFAAVVEYLQYRGMGIFGSTFDPYDFVAYFAGIVSAIVLDLTVLNKIIKRIQSV